MRWILFAILAVAAGCDKPVPPAVSLEASWFTDVPGGARGYQLVEVRSPVPGGGKVCFSAIIMNTHENRITYMDTRGKVKVDNRDVLMPDADGRVWVLDPSFKLHVTEVQADDIKKYLTEGKVDQLLASDDWVKQLAPLLKQYEWPKR